VKRLLPLLFVLAGCNALTPINPMGSDGPEDARPKVQCRTSYVGVDLYTECWEVP
jgi:hypothetical protein